MCWPVSKNSTAGPDVHPEPPLYNFCAVWDCHTPKQKYTHKNILCNFSILTPLTARQWKVIILDVCLCVCVCQCKTAVILDLPSSSADIEDVWVKWLHSFCNITTLSCYCHNIVTERKKERKSDYKSFLDCWFKHQTMSLWHSGVKFALDFCHMSACLVSFRLSSVNNNY